jgi:hypothetical protein
LTEPAAYPAAMKFSESDVFYTVLFSICVIIGSLAQLAAIFHTPLGIQYPFDLVLQILAIALFATIIYVRKWALKENKIKSTPQDLNSKKKKFILFVILYAIVGASSPFILPLAGPTLGFSGDCAIGLVTFCVCIAITWISLNNTK